MTIPDFRNHAIDDFALWVEVFDSNGDRVGTGPIIEVKSIQVRRALDGIGTFEMQVTSTSQEVSDYITTEANIRVYTFEWNTAELTFSNQKRLVVSGIVKKINYNESSGNYTLSVTGKQDMDELSKRSVLLGREYDDTIPNIVSSLLGIVGGWTDTTTPTSNYYARFDGVSVFKALQRLAEDTGNHVRAGDTANSIEFGPLGTDEGIVLTKSYQPYPDISENADVGVIEKAELASESEDVITRIYPLGSGIGETFLTLENSTRSTGGGDPYDISSETGPDGRTVYYIVDTAAEAEYGRIEKVLQFDQIQVQSNSDADLTSAANALYDVAVAYLQRNKDVQRTYKFSVRNLKTSVKPGDKVTVYYKGDIRDYNDNLLPGYNIADKFWVTQVTETINIGSTHRLTVSNIDKRERDAAEVVVGEIENAQINKLNVKAYTSHWGFVYQEEIDSTHVANLPLEFTGRTLRVRQVILRLQTKPFRATAKAVSPDETATAGSSARFLWGGSVSGEDGGPYFWRTVRVYDNQSGSVIYLRLPIEKESGDFSLMTNVNANEHSHDLPAFSIEYGIFDDTTYPGSVTVSINGTDRTSALGGPWGNTSTGIDQSLDITQYITSGTLRQVHDIEIGCGSGQGVAKGLIEVYEDIQSIVAT